MEKATDEEDGVHGRSPEKYDCLYSGRCDLWDCLDDGADTDQLADACVRVMSLNDLNAESTGGIFDRTGKRYFVSVQHNVTGHGVVLEIRGWRNDDDHGHGDGH